MSQTLGSLGSEDTSKSTRTIRSSSGVSVYFCKSNKVRPIFNVQNVKLPYLYLKEFQTLHVLCVALFFLLFMHHRF